MIPGLVSVSFRHLTPSDILKLCTASGLQAIEWGGDVHVPAGDLQMAKKVAHLSEESGIRIVSYGSYFRLGQPEELFSRNLETAVALGAPVLRIWAGSKSSNSYTAKERHQLILQLQQIDEAAQKAGIIVAPEFHGSTLTDSVDSLSILLEEIPGQRLYWQPRWDWPERDRLKALDMIGDNLVHMHVFSWEIQDEKEIRLPLSSGRDMWEKIFRAEKRKASDACALLEFFENDDPEALVRDAETLKSWLS